MSGQDSSPEKRSWKKPTNTRQRTSFASLDRFRQPGQSALDAVRRASEEKCLLDPKELYISLLKATPEERKEALLLQYEVAKEKKSHFWIQEMRKNAACDFPVDWVDDNMPALNGQRMRQHRTKSSSRSASSLDNLEQPHDFRLDSNPNLPVHRSDAADLLQEDPKPKKSSMKSSSSSQSKEKKKVTLVEPEQRSKEVESRRQHRRTQEQKSSTSKQRSSREESRHTHTQERKRDTSTSKHKRDTEQRSRSPRRRSSERRRSVSESEDTLTVSIPSSKVQKDLTCPLECGSHDKKLRRHVVEHHLPIMFKRINVNLDVPAQVEALKWLLSKAFEAGTTLQGAVDWINTSRPISPDYGLNPIHHGMCTTACRILGVDPPEVFTLHPINSPAVLLFWRCLLAILTRCNSQDIRDFRWFGFSEPTMAVEVVQEALSESESEPGDLIVVDECDNVDSDHSEHFDEPSTSSGLPNVFDSHFHLDRTSKVIWPDNPNGHTVEELISVPKYGSSRPSVPVNVVGGVVVYSEPQNYPAADFQLDGPWKVAAGVHPKHYQKFSTAKRLALNGLLEHPKVAALGEIGLDRTIPPGEWRAQELVFENVLRMSKPELPLVLHLRGPSGDTYGSDVTGRCQAIMRRVCRREQKIHVHCFTGLSQVVNDWLSDFPNTFFGVTAAVRRFDEEQKSGLRAIPRNRLLLETDAPYFPVGNVPYSTPAYLGDTAAFVAVYLNIGPCDLMQLTLRNAMTLYGS
ncbi:hypothetical protein FSP39_005212 [Pinctada imbricata]|uniref:TatD n=2 Tax=Pinctada imbricata TaxID=66713 RepID=A0AA88YWX0_PINIB|nr:hypothetical protein FSP39_004132 [Pinctada imbricata]KAK3108303.1 hypothetical protein FSP39_005212 [Pinctada imbricata]